MKTRFGWAAAATLFAVWAAVSPRSALAVDFETIPGLPAPIDTMQINSHFWSTAGVRFEYEGGGYPTLAQRGGAITAFTGPGGNDAPAVGAPVGDFFITSPTFAVIPSPLRIVFAAPVQSVSGVLIDVDGAEAWSVEAWGGGVLRASVALNLASPGAGDGTAAPWSFVRGSPDIDYVRLVCPTGAAGWAADNLVFTPVTPGTIPPSTAPIDFESIPVLGAPSDRLEINTHFRESHGVTFSLTDGTSPEIANVGDPLSAFAGPAPGFLPDTPALFPDQGVGGFFLTDDGLFLEQTPAIVVSYDPPTAEASGVVLDVDNFETFTVEARRSDGTVVQSFVITAGDDDTGDGVATPWAVRLDDPIVTSIRFLGARPEPPLAFGQGFDRFDARSAPSLVPVSPFGVAGVAVGLLAAARFATRAARRTRGDAGAESREGDRWHSRRA